MNTLFQKIPFLRITVAFAIGIILGSYFQIPFVISFSFVFFFLVLILFIHKNYSYKKEVLFGCLSFLLFIALGATRFIDYNPEPSDSSGMKIIQLLESPQVKKNSYKSLASIESIIIEDNLVERNENILLYFQKSADAKDLQPGDQIVVKKEFQAIRNNGNPHEFNYKGFLANKKIYRQVYLKPDDWKIVSSTKLNLRIVAERTRNSLLEIYKDQNMGKRETEILSALTLGYKQSLDQQTKQTFSSAGVIHVLAVSGLHVGIIFLVFQYCFGFMRRQKIGRILFVILSIIILWGYAFLTGLSPSVMRAASMFSLVCIATNLNRLPNIYNTLAASALILLLINPNNLFEVGFQLSYTAVFGIVFLQPRLYKLFTVNNKLLRFFWSLLTVSLAAQISTFPLTAFYFNQFPSYFLIANLLIIPAVMALIPLGLSLLVLSFIPFLASFISYLINWIISFCYQFLTFIEVLPYSRIPITFSPIELVFLILAFTFLFLYLHSLNAKHLKLFLSFSLILFTSITFSIYLQQFSKKLVVFNSSNNTCILVANGRNTTIISEKPISEDDFLFREIKTLIVKERLIMPDFVLTSERYENSYLLLENQLLIFNDRLFCFGTNKANSNIEVNYIIDSGYKNWHKKSFAENTQIITNHSFYSQFNPTQKIHFLNQNGAYQKHW